MILNSQHVFHMGIQHFDDEKRIEESMDEGYLTSSRAIEIVPRCGPIIGHC